MAAGNSLNRMKALISGYVPPKTTVKSATDWRPIEASDKSVIQTGKGSGTDYADTTKGFDNSVKDSSGLKVVTIGGKKQVLDEDGNLIVNGATMLDSEGNLLKGIDRNKGMFAREKDIVVPLSKGEGGGGGGVRQDYGDIDEPTEEVVEEEDAPPDINNPPDKGGNEWPKPELPKNAKMPLDPRMAALLFQKDMPYNIKDNALNNLSNSGAGTAAGMLNAFHNLLGRGAVLPLDDLGRAQAISKLTMGDRPLTEMEEYQLEQKNLQNTAPFYKADAQREVANSYSRSGLLRALALADATKDQSEKKRLTAIINSQPRSYNTGKKVDLNVTYNGDTIKSAAKNAVKDAITSKTAMADEYLNQFK